MSVPTQEPQIAVSPATTVSILLIILGTIGLTVGFTFAYGLPALFATPGVIMLALGVAIGFRN